jgi:hypothetical protein
MVHLVLNENDEPVGWALKPETDEEQKIAAIIRDLQFFGLNETAVEYNGIQLINNSKGKVIGNIKSISWIQKKYQK